MRNQILEEYLHFFLRKYFRHSVNSLLVYNTIIILLVIINVQFLLNRNNYVVAFSSQDNIYLTEYDKLLAFFMGRDLKLRDRLSHFRHNPFIWKKMRYEHEVSCFDTGVTNQS